MCEGLEVCDGMVLEVGGARCRGMVWEMGGARCRGVVLGVGGGDNWRGLGQRRRELAREGGDCWDAKGCKLKDDRFEWNHLLLEPFRQVNLFSLSQINFPLVRSIPTC